MFFKITVKTQADYIALAESGKLRAGQYVFIEEMARNVRYGGVRREGGSLTFWNVKGMTAAQFSKAVRAMCAGKAPVAPTPAPVVRSDRPAKRIILRSALAGLLQNDRFIGVPALGKGARSVEAAAALVEKADFNTVLTVYNKDGKPVGKLEIVDGDNHEIFGNRTLSLDRHLYEAFGLINEANDYGLAA